MSIDYDSRWLSAGVLLFLGLSLAACASMRSAGPDAAVVVPLENTIHWATASESNNFGFDVYRGDSAEGPFERLTEKPIQGGMESDETLRYQFIDDTIAEGAIYYYYVESISLDNRRARFTPIQASKPKHRAP